MADHEPPPRMKSPPAGYYDLPATPDNLALFSAPLRLLHTCVRKEAARTRAPGNVEVAKHVSALTGQPLSPGQVGHVRDLFAHLPWTQMLPRRPMDLTHRTAPIAVRVEELR